MTAAVIDSSQLRSAERVTTVTSVLLLLGIVVLL